jgi:hypothetical protein
VTGDRLLGAAPTANSIFARHGAFPSSPAIRDITVREQARRLMSYLAARGYLRQDAGWDYLTATEQDALVEELTRVLRTTEQEVRKAALAELAEYERRALAHQCPKCRAQEGTQCWDMRPGYQRRHVSHPHQERMEALAEEEGTA